MTGHFEFDIEDIFQGASFHEVPHFALQYGVMVFQILRILKSIMAAKWPF